MWAGCLLSTAAGDEDCGSVPEADECFSWCALFVTREIDGAASFGAVGRPAGAVQKLEVGALLVTAAACLLFVNLISKSLTVVGGLTLIDGESGEA